jgi:hypothetical protein
LARAETARVTLVASEEKIGGAPDVEHPDRDQTQAGSQDRESKQRQERSDEVAVC